MPKKADYDILEIQRLRLSGKKRTPFTEVARQLGYEYRPMMAWLQYHFDEKPNGKFERKLRSE